jgi:ABC-2 type transport system permease protein
LVNISGLIQKEFNRLRTDKRSLFLIFAIPIILIVIFGLTSGGGAQKFFTVTIVTVDELPFENWDSTQVNQTIVNNTAMYDELFIQTVQNNCSSFGLKTYWNVTDPSTQESALNAALNQLKYAEIDAVIVLPANFSETIVFQLNPHLIVYCDGSQPGIEATVVTALQEPIALFKLQSQALENFTVAFHNFEYDVPEWKNQVLNYAVAIVIPLIIIGTTMNLTSLAIVSEDPLPRLALTPSGKRELLFAKFIAYSIIMIVQATEIFAVINIFGLYVRGLDNLFPFYLGLILIGATGITLGIAISAIARNPKQANQLFITAFIVITLFSDTFLPITRIPAIFQFIAGLLPLAYATPLLIEIQLRGLILNGNNVLMLLALSVVYYLIAFIAFHLRKVEV